MESHSNNNNNNNNNNNVNSSSNNQTQQQQQTNVITTGQSFTPAAVAAAAPNNNQTVAIQQQPNNNNVIATLPQSFTPSSMHAGGGGGQGQASTQPTMYNQPLHPSNIYMPAPGVHQSAGPMYPAMIQTQIPSNVFVNNVTANVNLHGWAHSVPAYIQSGGPHHYIHGEVPTDQNGQVMQPLQAMPIALAPSNAITGPSGNGNPSNPSAMGGSGGGGGRGSRRGRGRGGSGGSRRSDYNNQRHMLQQEGSPAPQQMTQDQMQQQQMNQQQQQQSQQLETQLMPAGPHTYVPHPQYAHAAPPYPYAYQTYFAPQSHMLHPSQTAAQQATGTPLYVSSMPLYNSPQVYMGGYIYPPPIMNAAEYQYVSSDDGQGDDRHSAEAMIPQIWHTQPMYPEEYDAINAEMHGVSAEDLNHNPSSLGSSETPSMLSPNYPIYDQQMHEMQQQMGVLQLYGDPQTGQIQQMHTGGLVQQLEDDMSECDAQTGGTIQMVSSSGAILTAAPMQMPSDTQVLHHGHPQQPQHHLMQAALMGMEPQQQAHLQAQQQHQQYNSVTLATEQQQHIIVDNNNQNNEIIHLQSGESMSSLNEGDGSHQSSENIDQDYQQQLQLQQPQQHQPQNAAEISGMVAANENYIILCNNSSNSNINNNNNNKLIMTDANEFIESVPNNNDIAIVANIPTAVPATQQQQIQTSPQQLQQQQHHHHQHHTTYQLQQQQQQHEQVQQTQPPPQAQIQQQTQTQAQSPPPPPQQQQQQQQQQQPQQHHHQTQYHPQQHQHEQRKQPQSYSQQSRRKFTSDYNSNNNNMQQQQQQQHQPHVPSNNNNNNIDSSIQTTKSMSWTNSSQHKKSTASVAVTATPASNNSGSSSSSNKQSNSSYSHPTKTYTNQQHHYQQPIQHYHSHHQQQQQQQQQQQNYNQPQMRNYGAMKMPSSPVGTAPPQLISGTGGGGGDRKNSQVELQQQQPKNNYNQSSSTTATTSTASTTATPQQFSQQQNASAEQVSSSTPSASAFTSTTHHNNKQYPGFAHKKSMTSHNTATVATAVAPPPAINLAPPVTNVNAANSTPAGTPSWASLFANKSSNNATVAAAVATPAQITATGANNVAAAAVTNQLTSTQLSTVNMPQSQPQLPQQTAINNIGSTTHSNPPFLTKKPIAKVAPYEGITPVIPTPAIIPPGGMSYSAASAQGLPPPATAAATAAAAINSKPAKQQSDIAATIQRNSTNLDEWTLKFADFLTKYKTDLPPISLRPRGLTNRSNYCYINSILQALLGCSPFYNLIRAIPKQAAALSEVKTPTVNAMISFMSNFSTLPTGLRLRTNKGPKGKDDLGGDLQCDPAFEPTEIYKLWNDSREEHVEGRQEDAEEFLGYVLNKLNDEMLEVIKLIAKPNPEQNGQNDVSENEDGDAWQMIRNNRNKGSVTRQTDFGRTPLSDIFRGELRSRLQREGEHSTDVIQPFFTLQLNIEKAASVKEALEILVGRDQLEGVTGSKSKQEVVAWQQMTLEKLPVILILHLKWFDYRSDGCTKILKKVEFPVDLKIDTKILASKKYSQTKRAYRLFAVVYHDGKEASKGHYITDVYHTGYGSWLRYDDSSVKPVSENHVLLPRTPRVPYLLYYRRCDTMPQAPTSNAGNNNNTTSSSSGRERDSGK